MAGFDIISYSMGKAVGGTPIERTLQNSKINLNYSAYTKEGYIGGFSTDVSYWQPYNTSGSALDVDWSQPWTLHLKLMFTALETSRRECLYGCETSGQYFGGTITAEVLKEDNWWFGFSTNGSSWDYQTVISTSVVPYVVGVDYIIHIDYNGTTIAITVSDENHTGSATLTPASALYHNSSYKLAFGNIARSSSLYARYTYFDPNDCYIKSNGVMVWGSEATGSGSGNDGGIPGFTRVAYLATLANSHTGYIDTGVYPTSHHRVQTTFALTESDETAWYTIFGCRDGSLSRLVARYALGTSTPPNSLGIQYSTDAGQSATIVELSSITKANSVLVFRKLEFNKNEVYVDGTLVHTFTPPTGTVSYPYTLYLFALNNAGVVKDKASCFISKCRIWDENDALIRDFVPVIRNSVGVAGMYDLVNGVFYTSPSGDFCIGPSIEWE